MAPASAASGASKMRSIEELRLEFWKRSNRKLSEELSTTDDSEKNVEAPCMASLDQLLKDFKQKKSQAARRRPATKEETRHSRETLLAARVLLSATTQKNRAAGGIKTMPISSQYTQNPKLDDEKLLVKMEERLSFEDGSDLKNMETFGLCTNAWSYEEALAANEKLWTEFWYNDCMSTVADSMHHSEGPSSGISSPRMPASTVPTSKALPAAAVAFSMHSAEHAVASRLSADAAVFCPNSFAHAAYSQ